MTRKLKLWIGGGVGLALFAVLLGGTAFAASDTSPSSSLGQSFIDRLASNLGISSTDLQAKITQSGNETIDAAVANGTLTQQQGDALKGRIASGKGFLEFGRAFGDSNGGVKFNTLATTLGLTTTELRAQLDAGTALSDIITAQGKTVDEVVTALVAAKKTELDAAVANGQLTQAQADQILANLPARLTAKIANNTFGRHGGWSDGDGAGPDNDTNTNPNATPGAGTGASTSTGATTNTD